MADRLNRSPVIITGSWRAQEEISPEYSLEGLMFEAETPIIWPPDVKN